MMRVLSGGLLLVAMFLLSGCGGADKFPIAQAGGRVVCDGQPVANAQVYFEPLQTGKSAKVGKQAFAFTGPQGDFELTTYDRNDGAVVGKHRVRVGGDNTVKCDCVTNSERDVMEVEIVAGEYNSVEISLPKKTGREPAPKFDMEEED